jgi:hypothetical protein
MALLIDNPVSGANYIQTPIGGSPGIDKRGQTFQYGSNFDLTQITLTLYRAGTPGTIYLNVYATDASHYPTGASLSSGSYNGDSLPTSPSTLATFNMSAASLTASTEYAFVLTVPGGSPTVHEIYNKYSSGDPYSDGGSLIGYDDSTWAYLASIDMEFKVYGTTAGSPPSKASNPTPADASGPGIDFTTPTLSWTGDGDTYDVWGGAAGNWVKLADGISETTYTLSSVEKLLFSDGVATWRVDSINANGITTGDNWTFDPRPAKVTTPVPTDTNTGISINTTLAWAASTYATGYDVWVGSTKAVSNTDQVSVLPVAVLPLTWGVEYTWRIDPRNEYGATTGDEWTFTTLVLDPPRVFARYLSDNSIVPTGTAFNPATMYATGENGMGSLRRLVLFCGSSLWYESVDDTD